MRLIPEYLRIVDDNFVCEPEDQSNQVEVSQSARDSMISILEERLREAKEGRIHQIAIVVVTSKDKLDIETSEGLYQNELLTGSVRLTYKLNRVMDCMDGLDPFEAEEEEDF